jgi:hypothetical protein
MDGWMDGWMDGRMVGERGQSRHMRVQMHARGKDDSQLHSWA